MNATVKLLIKITVKFVCCVLFHALGENAHFCDYIEDNGHDEAAMISLNKSILDQVTGEFGVLEVINSGSCFELPKQTLDDIENVIKTKNIHKLFFESHWMYRKHLAAMRSRMPVPIIF